MDNQQHKWTKPGLKFLAENSNRSLIIGSIIATLIALTPYYFTLYESVPDTKVWDTFLFTYESGYYESAFILAWTLTNKLVPLFLLFIWFFTCRHWWFHTLLVPIALYVYQIIGVLNDDLKFFDTNQFLYLLPVMAIVIPSIYLIRARMFNKINDADKTMQELEDEFRIGSKGLFGKLRDYF
ncbi:hypothetical protein ACFO5O_06355 [Geojedonia litorea]|uniref:Uncharacterized protein n=1 Tax=Geojedonia litorea TaxID=1268269 RepID=A0ABV9N531_9FLAO